MELSSILYFLVASMALTIAPGPDNIFVLTQGITRGRRPAVVTALGMCSGVSVHTIAAAFGISAVFYTSALAFTAVKLLGAAYLLYLAFKTLRNRSSIAIGTSDNHDLLALYKRGFLMNVLNPKVAMFFIAFFPQFVSPAYGQVPLQMLLLGLIFMAQGTVIFTLIAYFSGTIGNFLLKRPAVAKYFNYLTAGVFASLGVKLALAQR